ncbi:hypothetical protein LEP1GSC104_0692 [Leptospira interrogans str. UI 12621]|uniref:Uncharacterized protein n=1 Tax=Leptospira interrogans str. UI 12621 TaxID=1049937 RepID=A0A0F6H880_LEPIR|nr:hypothetical protein LEP1GSC104_0692 [Leptospira interrogans str. UI 12621]
MGEFPHFIDEPQTSREFPHFADELKLRGSSHILQMNLNLRGSSHIFKSWAFDKENQISAQNRRSTIVFT